MEKKLVLGASLGNCVHVAGVAHFLSLAEKEGYLSHFMGPAVTVDRLFETIDKIRPDIVGISYRLTPENVIPLLESVKLRITAPEYKDIIWVFGGTLPVARIAKKYKFFTFISDGRDNISDSIFFLRHLKAKNVTLKAYEVKDDLISRIDSSYPYPLLRHHFGLPSLQETEKGIKEISRARVLDVISLGPDQNAQQFFFNKDKMSPLFDGAGGVPVRSHEDFTRLKTASRCGNFPLMRCYSGTEDVFLYADMLLRTINNAWTAIPLCWYNELDGRGNRSIEDSIAEAQELIKWHAERNIPVEINEPHHWALRDSHDVISVAMAYLSAYNAKKLKVRNYIAQYMFNVPSGISFPMDLARILAMIEMVESLQDDSFRTFREVRTGLPLLSADRQIAKGQLAASTFVQMAVKPHIIHVVGFCEADHAANAKEVIESCKIVKGIIQHTVNEDFSMQKDKSITERKNELILEAKYLLNFIEKTYSGIDDPLSNANIIADSIKKGYLDAVHIVKGDKFRGELSTKILDGKCLPYDRKTGNILTEKERLDSLLRKGSEYGE